ncbi:MAG TPA: dienelactone hydrolase family protein [Polyangiales bacterium]|nr:dienelactone hydrolase family protein [Polyangiales bacterium]
MGIHVEVPLHDGDGFRGYEATPDGASLGSVLIVHEWFGLNEGMRTQADRFAAAGFHALAVDLFYGQVAGDAESARRLAAEMKTQHAMQVISAAAEHVRNRPDGNGKVCIAGFCMGGAVALAAASHVEGLSATATFCGMPPSRYRDVQRIHAPVMGHYGLRDPLLPVAQPQALFDSLVAAGKRALFHVYDAGHAFMRSGTQSYHAAVAELAWQRTLGFFREAVP